MAVRIEEVPVWWVVDGIGHVLFSKCACGECEDSLAAMCGLRSRPVGSETTAAPAAICSVCLRLLAAPTLKLGEPRRASRAKVEVLPLGTVKASELPGVIAAIAAMQGAKPAGPVDN